MYYWSYLIANIDTLLYSLCTYNLKFNCVQLVHTIGISTKGIHSNHHSGSFRTFFYLSEINVFHNFYFFVACLGVV